MSTSRPQLQIHNEQSNARNTSSSANRNSSEGISNRQSSVSDDVRNLTSNPGEYALDEIRELLQDIRMGAGDVASLGREHRSGSLWDVLPILSNIRSHIVAGKEAETIELLKEDMQKLETLVAKNNLNVNMKKIREAVASLQEPGGISMWAATILPFFRMVHRSATPQRTENVRLAARKLGGELRRAA